MKKLLALFFIVSFLCFGEETSTDKSLVKPTQMKEEIEMLKNQVIELKSELEEVMKKDNKDQVYSDSLKYYERAKDDAKEIYNKSTKDAKEIFNYSITLIMSLVAGVGAILLALLGFIRFENKKQLEKEKTEIIENTKEIERELKNHVKVTLEKVEKTEKQVDKNEQGLKRKIENEAKNLKDKFNKIIEKHGKEIDGIKIEMNKEVLTAKFNNELSVALNKKDSQEKIIALKKLEENIEKLPNESKLMLYFEIGYYLNMLGNVQDALFAYNKAIELGVMHVVSYNNRGEIYLTLDNFDSALIDLAKCIKIDKEYKFEIDVLSKNYNKFIEFLENKNDLNNFGKEVYRRFRNKEGIEIKIQRN